MSHDTTTWDCSDATVAILFVVGLDRPTDNQRLIVAPWHHIANWLSYHADVARLACRRCKCLDYTTTVGLGLVTSNDELNPTFLLPARVLASEWTLDRNTGSVLMSCGPRRDTCDAGHGEQACRAHAGTRRPRSSTPAVRVDGLTRRGARLPSPDATAD